MIDNIVCAWQLASSHTFRDVSCIFRHTVCALLQSDLSLSCTFEHRNPVLAHTCHCLSKIFPVLVTDVGLCGGRWSFGILMYELVYGFTPFRGTKRDQTFDNILKRPLVFPQRPEISKPCQVRAAI